MTEQNDLAEPVTVAWVSDGRTVDYNFFHSWTALLAHDAGAGARVWQGGNPIDMRAGTDGLVDCRNQAVQIFLDERPAEWMIWFDTDMGFAADVVDRLIEVADPTERPIVGALCFAAIEGKPDGFGGWRTTAVPTVYDWAHDNGADGFAVRWNYPPNTVTRVAGTGSACILIHRSVFERIREEFGPNWYSRLPNPSTGQLISEDLSFCVRANALNIPVFVHTGVETTHAKPMWLSQEHYWRERALNPPPWTPEPQSAPMERTGPKRFAIIPTHNRPARLLSLAVSLGGQCDTIVVLDNASTPPVDAAQLQASVPDGVTVEVLRNDLQPPNLAAFWNIMLEYCAIGSEAHDVAVLNDDSVVPAGWYDACSTALRAHDTAVIAHTTPTTPELLVELHNEPNNRMTPHAFVIRGEVGLRADESMHWWYQDSDLDWQARLAGGVLSVPGPQVVNALANRTTTGVLAQRAELDRIAFEKKWANR